MDLDFLSQAASGDSTATLMILLPDGTVSQIRKVSPFTILDNCPLLYHAFEFGAHSVRQASIEATSRTAVVSLLRFLYTGNYLAADREDQPCSLLIHAEAFKVGEDYDVPELQVSAYVNFTRETEFSCCMATPPPDLCKTIQFLYKHLASQQSRQQQSLLDTLLNYCLATFKYQGLGEREDFRRVVFENPAFHKDLCRTSMQRNFEDEGALDIVRLPVCSSTPHSCDHLNKRALGDFQFELWQDPGEPASSPDSNVESSPAKRRKSELGGRFKVVYRPKDAKEMPIFSETESESESDSSSDENGFTLVHRPKLNVDTALTAKSPLSVPSSPELVSPTPITKAELPSESSVTPSIKVEPKGESSTSSTVVKSEPQDETLASPTFIKVEPPSNSTSDGLDYLFEDDWDFI